MITLAFIFTTLLILGVWGMLAICHIWPKQKYMGWKRKLDTIFYASTVLGFLGLAAFLWGCLFVVVFF